MHDILQCYTNSTVFVEFPNIFTHRGAEPSVSVALAHSAPQARMHMYFPSMHVPQSRDLDHIVSVDVCIAYLYNFHDFHGSWIMEPSVHVSSREYIDQSGGTNLRL